MSVGNAQSGRRAARATPDLRALTTFGFRRTAVGAGLRWRYQASMDDVSAVLTPNTVQPGVPSYSLWDLFRDVALLVSASSARAARTILFDKKPPFVASSQTGIDVRSVRRDRPDLLPRVEGELLTTC